MKLKFIILLVSCLAVIHPSIGQEEYSPTGRNRMAAEWEPAIGVLISWPLWIPHNLVIELAKDTKLYTLVNDDEAKKDAIIWFSKWQIDPKKIIFIKAPQGVDAAWVRDWGPHAVFTENGTMKLADGKYQFATPVTGINCDDPLHFIYLTRDKQIIKTEIDDKAPQFIALSFDFEMVQLPFAFTGGNVISDGQQNAFSTCALVNENLYAGEPEEKFLSDARKLLGIQHYNLISNFEENGIQHIDCFMKMLDEERLFVMQPPADHPAFAVYQNIVDNELSKLTNAYGRPYQILRLNTERYRADALAAYSNSLILNKTVYVPLFGIKQDSVALSQWAAAMPGYTIKGFEYLTRSEPSVANEAIKHYGSLGWSYGDALHCRTRALWDPEMLYLSVDRIPAYVQPATDYPVSVIVKDYSLKGLVGGSLKLSWKVKGSSTWNEIPLIASGRPDVYNASIPGAKTGVTVEYFISAKSKSGRSESMPRPAPAGVYVFSVL